MRTAFDFAPFRRSTIGFDRLFDLLENSAVGQGGENYPPFDLISLDDNRYRISLAVAGIPFISVMSDPTTGGVFASFAALGDVNIAEPNALVGFAGARVAAGTTGGTLPEGFQRAEFLYRHGFVDLVVPRAELRATLASLLTYLTPHGLLELRDFEDVKTHNLNGYNQTIYPAMVYPVVVYSPSAAGITVKFSRNFSAPQVWLGRPVVLPGVCSWLVSQ